MRVSLLLWSGDGYNSRFYLPAPTISLHPPLALNAGRLAKFFYKCPDNAFQVALSGTSFSLLQRIGAIVRNGAKLFAVGTTSSLVNFHYRIGWYCCNKCVDKCLWVDFARFIENQRSH
ncbi:hypothetical protein BUALT_Bualt13G0039800 [Buddleja alternifolia]|uniref:Uncharacterized protein n=1 Tax=Buddleja alternifolia TaxID=168488 RepID=A0AAV6WTP5_9LAMI|nr:hypothetical protein BUALT_Bualt13G0039800 [Buddleja alternifolia]